MKIGYWLLTVFVCLTVYFWWMYLKARSATMPVYDVLAIDKRIEDIKKDTEKELKKERDDKFAICKTITTVPLDKLDAIVKTCWEHLQLK